MSIGARWEADEPDIAAIRDVDHARGVGADGWAVSAEGLRDLLVEWQGAQRRRAVPTA